MTTSSVVRTPPLVSGSLPVLGHLVEFLRHPVELIERGARETDGVFRIHIPGKPTVVLLGAERSRFFFSETDKSLSIRTAYPFFVRMFDPAFYFFAEMEDTDRTAVDTNDEAAVRAYAEKIIRALKRRSRPPA